MTAADDAMTELAAAAVSLRARFGDPARWARLARAAAALPDTAPKRHRDFAEAARAACGARDRVAFEAAFATFLAEAQVARRLKAARRADPAVLARRPPYFD